MKIPTRKCSGNFYSSRIKRSVQAKFNAEVNFISSQILAARQMEQDEAPLPEDGEEAAPGGTKVVGFVRAEKTEPKAREQEKPLNPDEIEIEDSDEESDASEPQVDQVSEQAIPAAVFGSLAHQVQDEKLGAKDRFKRKRAE